MTGNSQAAAQKCNNEAADDDHLESDSISDNEANSEEEEDEDEDEDKRSEEDLESDRIIKAGFWRLDFYDFDSLSAPEESVQGIEAEAVDSPATTTNAVVRVAICPIEGHDVDLKGVEGVMAHIIDELYDVEKARGSFDTLQGAHGMAAPFVRASVERGIPMATMNFMLNVAAKEVRDWAEGELSQGTVAEESVRRLQKKLQCQSFSRERRSIREACQSYIGHVYELSFDVKEYQVSADPADSIFKVLLRDPIILAHDIVSSSNVLARGEKLHLSAVDGPLSHFCHGTRYKTMLTKVHNEVRRLKQGGEGAERALPWADVDPATVVVLPLAFFIGDAPVCKSGALTQCPIVMTVLWFDSHGFQRNNTKRIMGYIPSPPGDGDAPHKAALLKRACRQAAQRAILDLVNAWQHAAFRKGGLVWRVADGRLVRAIPAPALFLGNSKEQNLLAGTMERTRCRMCSANVSTMLKGEAMPEGPMRDFFDLKQTYGRLRREDRASRIAFQEKHGLQVDGSQGLFQTTVDFFAGKEVYRMFCFDTMHTLNLGPLKDILIATLSSVQTRKNKTCKLKTLSKNMNGASSGLSQIQSDALADLQLYMHRAGNLPANALQRNRLEAKHILPLARATLTAFLHDLAFEAAEEQILPIARDLRVLLWALAAAVRVTHELTRPALDSGALPAAKEEVRELSRLVQRFRLLGGFKEMTTLKTHALSHMVDQIAFTGGTAFCDTASFEHYHLLVAKAARLVNNTDKTGSHMLHRAMELDAARILTPADPPDECKRARTIGEQGGAPHCAGIDVAEAASITIKHIRNVQEQVTNLDALEEALRGKLEETFEGAPAVDGFVKGKMGSIDLRVVGAKPLRWRAKPPTLFLTRDKSFFAPLLFLRSVSVPDTAKSSQSKFWVAGAVVGRDEDLHARLEKTTYASNPLSGFAVVDLGESLIHLRPDQLQIKSIDDLAAGDTIWLKPPSEEEMHRKIVFILRGAKGEAEEASRKSGKGFRGAVMTPTGDHGLMNLVYNVSLEENARVRALAGTGVDALNECKFRLEKIAFGYDRLLLWLALLGLASALLENYLHRLERKSEMQKSYLRFLRQTYKELVILGFLSFFLIMLRDFYPNMTKNAFLIIEMAHLWLFSVGIAFIFVAIQISSGLVRSKRLWDTAFTHGLQVIEAEYRKFFEWNTFVAYFVCLIPGYFYTNTLHEQVKLWILRKQFIKVNHMPSTFDFPKYLRKTLTVNMFKAVEIGWQSWAVLCSFFFIGYMITAIVDKGTGSINSDVASIGCVSMTLFITLLASRMGAALKGGSNRYFRLLGCSRPHDFETLLEFAKEVYSNEDRQHHARVLNGFSHDDLRLQQVLRECRNNNVLSQQDITTKHSIFGTKHHDNNGFEKHMPLFSPTAFVVLLRIFILAQCYVMGLLFVLWMGHTNFTSIFIGVTVTEIFLHLYLFGRIIPELMRDFALMGSVLILNEAALDRIEDTFQHHKSTNAAIYDFSQILFESYRRCAFELFPTVMPNLDEESQIRVIDAVFKELSPNGAKRVGAISLCKRLQGRMRPRKMKLVFRALNTPRGLTVDECRFLIKGMIVINAETENMDRNLELCFGKAEIRCGLCGAMVSTDDVDEHAGKLCPKLPASEGEELARTIPSPNTAIKDLLERLVGEEGVLNTSTRYGLLQPHFDEDLWAETEAAPYQASFSRLHGPLAPLSFKVEDEDSTYSEDGDDDEA
ncbi:Hypothetical Protein FCC1311_061152 [Hondaea fermentalgiana]|uniref:Uncharacterized protein n=1 Tax=Hondaea fermentalgiana TaxID=2315210 RepID=A0A2R5GH26_9STRA|nr:Hypothetical Protein FCC1311_061152 [Hondaea fermentalgiana]|eukprot:GBG29895.1 Hypothetical Protein FCC1311_061152 [Hondaea fermentalgiana]